MLAPVGPVTVDADDYAIVGTAEAGSLVKVFVDGDHDGLPDDPANPVARLQLEAAGMSFLDFETKPGGEAPEDNTELKVPYVRGDASVTFGFDTDEDLNLDVNARFESRTDPEREILAYFSAAGPDGDRTDTGEGGNWLLRAPQYTQTRDEPIVRFVDGHDFLVVYSGTLPTAASGQLWDVDTEEKYTIDALGPAGNVLDRITVEAAPGGNLGGKPFPFRFSDLASGISIIRISGDVTTGANFIGFAFDNFDITGGTTEFVIRTPLTPNAINHFVLVATDPGGTPSAPVPVPPITEDAPDVPTPENPSPEKDGDLIPEPVPAPAPSPHNNTPATVGRLLAPANAQVSTSVSPLSPIGTLVESGAVPASATGLGGDVAVASFALAASRLSGGGGVTDPDTKASVSPPQDRPANSTPNQPENDRGERPSPSGVAVWPLLPRARRSAETIRLPRDQEQQLLEEQWLLVLDEVMSGGVDGPDPLAEERGERSGDGGESGYGDPYAGYSEEGPFLDPHPEEDFYRERYRSFLVRVGWMAVIVPALIRGARHLRQKGEQR